MDLRQLIIDSMKSRGWSVYRLAKESGLPGPTVYPYIRGDRDLRGKAIGQLCEALGLEVRQAGQQRKGGSD